jgi:TetR/AcrR family transcriptional regulator
MARPRKGTRPDTRTAILRAAREEFARQGFSATGVDRIARRARANKALIYYYFGSKLALYREVLRTGLDFLAARLAAVPASRAGAEAKLERWIEELAAAMQHDPSMPPIILRELADGGTRLDPELLRRMTALVPMVVGILEQGRNEGVFDATDPLAMHLVLMGAIILFTVNAPIRKRIRQLGLAQPPLEMAPFVQHLQRMAIRSLRKEFHHADSIA